MPRRLGQHFLIRDSVLERLAMAACGEHTPRVIEIGAGSGALTRHLLAHTDELHAIEIDDALVAHLASRYGADPKLHIHASDVLGTDLTQWGPAVIAGNLPYYITSPIVNEFLQLDSRFPQAVFLVQQEVAQRILARPSTRDYGFLTVATQLVCDVQLVCEVPRTAFRPQPNVDSAAIRLVRKPEAPRELAELLKFVGRCFAHKRKTLRNNLRPFYGNALDSLAEGSRRAEQLSITQFIEFYAKLTAAC